MVAPGAAANATTFEAAGGSGGGGSVHAMGVEVDAVKLSSAGSVGAGPFWGGADRLHWRGGGVRVCVRAWGPKGPTSLGA